MEAFGKEENSYVLFGVGFISVLIISLFGVVFIICFYRIKKNSMI